MKLAELLFKVKPTKETVGTIGAGTAAPSPVQQQTQDPQAKQLQVDPEVAAQQQLLMKKQMQDQVKMKQDELLQLKQQLAKMI